MAKIKQTGTALVKGLSDDILQNLKPELRQRLTALLNAGEKVSVINGEIYVHHKVEQPEITSWEDGEEVTGIIVSTKLSTEYVDNWLATIKTLPDEKLLVKPLNITLKGMVDTIPEGAVLTIKCTGEKKGKKFTYKTFEVSFITPLKL